MITRFQIAAREDDAAALLAVASENRMHVEIYLGLAAHWLATATTKYAAERDRLLSNANIGSENLDREIHDLRHILCFRWRLAPFCNETFLRTDDLQDRYDQLATRSKTAAASL